MPSATRLTLTEQATVGLFFIQRYRFLTIDQFARVAGMNRHTAGNQLRRFELQGLLDHFGNTRLNGHGKTPKAYFLTRKGYQLVREESDISEELLGRYKEVKVEAAWSPQMYHRLRTVDLMLAAELGIRQRAHLSMVQTFLEYRRARRGNLNVPETLDYVATGETPENKIIPDAAFIMENIETKRRALFFIEMDMTTERIISAVARTQQTTLRHKFSQYDRYLKSLRYQQTYASYGEFRSFIMLFVTLNEQRIENIRRELQDLPSDLAAYYRLATFDLAMQDFFSAIWKSRALSDTSVYPLVRG
jgi:hypothetical protein